MEGMVAVAVLSVGMFIGGWVRDRAWRSNVDWPSPMCWPDDNYKVVRWKEYPQRLYIQEEGMARELDLNDAVAHVTGETAHKELIQLRQERWQLIAHLERMVENSECNYPLNPNLAPAQVLLKSIDTTESP